jgi:hypothetical protein
MLCAPIELLSYRVYPHLNNGMPAYLTHQVSHAPAQRQAAPVCWVIFVAWPLTCQYELAAKVMYT